MTSIKVDLAIRDRLAAAGSDRGITMGRMLAEVADGLGCEAFFTGERAISTRPSHQHLGPPTNAL
jgi:hypothetical protein